MEDEKPMEISEALKKHKLFAEVEKEKEKEETRTNIYYGIRFVQVLCIGAFVFGALWEGTLVFNMNTPQFMMTYGGCGAIISEVVARIFKKKMLK